MWYKVYIIGSYAIARSKPHWPQVKNLAPTHTPEMSCMAVEFYLIFARPNYSRITPTKRSAMDVHPNASGAPSERGREVQRVCLCRKLEWSTPRVKGATLPSRNWWSTKATGGPRTQAQISWGVSTPRRAKGAWRAHRTIALQDTKDHVRDWSLYLSQLNAAGRHAHLSMFEVCSAFSSLSFVDLPYF